MRLIALLGTVIFGSVAGVAACGQGPVQPSATTAVSDATPSDARAKKAPPVCESSVYPTSLCLPANRPALCEALNGPAEISFSVMVGARPATASFSRSVSPAPGGSLEVVTIARGYGLPPSVLNFSITDAQIAQICPTATG